MAKKIVLALLVIVAALVLFISTRPDTFHVERSATIAAPAEIVFAQIDDFHAWPRWSPWEKLDPDMKRTFGGSPSGQGATYSWVGNDKVGEGKMTILDSTRPSKVDLQLDFIKPFPSTSRASFALVPAEVSTRVTWSMDGKHNFMSKTMCLFMDMDQMVGADFEKGLASLNGLASAAAHGTAAAPGTAAAQ